MLDYLYLLCLHVVIVLRSLWSSKPTSNPDRPLDYHEFKGALQRTMADEKNISDKVVVASSDSQLSRTDDEGQEITWTEEEEKALLRR